MLFGWDGLLSSVSATSTVQAGVVGAASVDIGMSCENRRRVVWSARNVRAAIMIKISSCSREYEEDDREEDNNSGDEAVEDSNEDDEDYNECAEDCKERIGMMRALMTRWKHRPAQA
jgi:hypothetical protein